MAEGRQDTVTEPAATPEATAVAAYLGLTADTLVDRSIDFAKRNGYAPYTTTIRAAWLEAVLSLSEALVRYLSLTRKRLGPEAGCDYETDPRFARMRQIARKHRARGVTLQLYLGLFKHFRRVYLEVLEGLDPKPGAAMLSDVLDFFDETELSIASDWTGTTKEEKLRELQARTRQLALEKDRYFAIFESLRNPAFLLDRERALVHANHAAAETFVGNVAAGDSVYLRSREDVRTRLREVLRDLPFLTDDPERTVWLETIQGRRCFEMRLRVLHDTVENIPLGYLLQFYDVTAHRQATETAQQAELQMSRFLATMSHEIRTPLHSVLGAAELLRQAEGDSQDSYLDVIQAAGQSLLQTLNNVLDYSKLGGGPPEPRPVETDIAAALDTFCATVAIGHEARRTSLSLDLDGALPDRLMIDWAIVR